MAFILGNCYTRQEIHDLTGGGDLQTFLPNSNGKILCACLSQEYGPGIRPVILVGQGPTVQREAEMFCKQAEAVPVFYKKKANQWEYTGIFLPEKWTEDPGEIDETAESAGRINLTKIIFLRRIDI